jgi:hypothetical protein
MELRNAGCNGNARLDTSQVGARVKHDSVTPFRLPGIVSGLPGVQQCRNTKSQGFSLCPTTIREGRVIGRGRGKVPAAVSCIESGAVSVLHMSPQVHDSRERGRAANLAIKTTAGPFAISITAALGAGAQRRAKTRPLNVACGKRYQRVVLVL